MIRCCRFVERSTRSKHTYLPTYLRTYLGMHTTYYSLRFPFGNLSLPQWRVLRSGRMATATSE